MTALSKSNNLSTSGRILANLLTVARSEAINQRRLIQLRVATKWMDLQGNEDITASYRKFSVWRKPSPEDPQQSSDPNDPYIQVSNWETLPAGITFADNTSGYTLPTAPDPRNPGSYFLTTPGTSKSGVKVSNGTADVAWIEFNPSGGANYSGTIPSRVYILVTEGFWNGTTVISTQSNRSNWVAATVDTLVGRIAILRP